MIFQQLLIPCTDILAATIRMNHQSWSRTFQRHSLLTAQGLPCSGEEDMKTAIAMKICDILGTGGSYSEIVAADYERGTIILGYDGPFRISIADGKPILRGMGLYHSK